MGVRTTSWGPHAWSFLHAIATVVPKGPLTAEFFRLLRDVLPCSYCRRSYESFYPELRPYTKTSWELFVYKVHCRVNLKLAGQDFDKGNDMTKWMNYEPCFTSVPNRKNEIPYMESNKVSRDMCFFMYYAMYDWDKTREANVIKWMDILAGILASRVSYGQAWAEAWGKGRKRMGGSLQDRLNVIRSLQSVTGSRTATFKYINAVCKKGVVGC